jgi:hypothetical protein
VALKNIFILNLLNPAFGVGGDPVALAVPSFPPVITRNGGAAKAGSP